MPTRPTMAGRERRVYALVASLPYSGAQTAFFSFEMTIESFLEVAPDNAIDASTPYTYASARRTNTGRRVGPRMQVRE